jgi:hypothetical protein
MVPFAAPFTLVNHRTADSSVSLINCARLICWTQFPMSHYLSPVQGYSTFRSVFAREPILAHQKKLEGLVKTLTTVYYHACNLMITLQGWVGLGCTHDVDGSQCFNPNAAQTSRTWDVCLDTCNGFFLVPAEHNLAHTPFIQQLRAHAIVVVVLLGDPLVSTKGRHSDLRPTALAPVCV